MALTLKKHEHAIPKAGEPFAHWPKRRVRLNTYGHVCIEVPDRSNQWYTHYEPYELRLGDRYLCLGRVFTVTPIPKDPYRLPGEPCIKSHMQREFLANLLSETNSPVYLQRPSF